MMNLIAILACLMAGATLGICVMACCMAAGKADEWAEEYAAAQNRSEVENRTVYRDMQRKAQ